MGRYYAMDRDNRWDRVEKAYNAIVSGEGECHPSAAAAIEQSYAAGVNDEFVIPCVICADGKPVGPVRDGDGFIFFNFRSDRAREITRALALDDFDGFERSNRPQLAAYVCMTEYDATFGLPIAFGPGGADQYPGRRAGQGRAKAQLRIAETEKYAHVTFFFNGGVEEPFPGEERCLDPLPQRGRHLRPETGDERLPGDGRTPEANWTEDRYDVIILNFANCDMVGHTGIIPAAVKAVEAVDACVGRLIAKVRALGGAALITADHGNADQMRGRQRRTLHRPHQQPGLAGAGG